MKQSPISGQLWPIRLFLNKSDMVLCIYIRRVKLRGERGHLWAEIFLKVGVASPLWWFNEHISETTQHISTKLTKIKSFENLNK